MTVDRERLADLAQKALDAYPKMETFSVGGDGCLDVTAFMQALHPQTVLALLADLDRAERERDEYHDVALETLDAFSNAIDEFQKARAALVRVLAEHGDVS